MTNHLVDAMGMTHFSRLHRLTGADVVEIALASLIAADLLDAWKLKERLRDIPGVLSSVEYQKLLHTERPVAELAQWLIQHGIEILDPKAVIKRFKKPFQQYEEALTRIITRRERTEFHRRVRYARNRNIRTPGTERAAGLDYLVGAANAVLLTDRIKGIDTVAAGALLKQVAQDTRLLQARQLANPTDAQNGWEARAMADLDGEISALLLNLATRALAELEIAPAKPRRTPRVKPLTAKLKGAWDAFIEERRVAFDRVQALGRRIESTGAQGLAPSLVLFGSVRNMDR